MLLHPCACLQAAERCVGFSKGLVPSLTPKRTRWEKLPPPLDHRARSPRLSKQRVRLFRRSMPTLHPSYCHGLSFPPVFSCCRGRCLGRYCRCPLLAKPNITGQSALPFTDFWRCLQRFKTCSWIWGWSRAILYIEGKEDAPWDFVLFMLSWDYGNQNCTHKILKIWSPGSEAQSSALKFNVNRHHLGILFKCKFWLAGSRMEPGMLHY